jgi:hypothetical protein
MKNAACVIVSVLCLSACNKGPDIHATNASVQEVATKVRAAAATETLIRPGEWQSDTTVTEMSMPGLPPQVQANMKKVMSSRQTHSFTSCVTEADVKRPKEDFFAGKNNQCRYDHFTMSGGKVDATMHCTSEGRDTTMKLDGRYSAENYQLNVEMSSNGGPEGAMSLKSHTVSHRIGECTAKDS